MENQEISPELEKEKSKKLEKQTITLLIILGLLLVSFVAGHYIFKPKPYFMYENLKVYPLRYGNSNIFLYSIPLTFDVKGTLYEEEILLKNNPYDIENISYSVNESLFTLVNIFHTIKFIIIILS